MFRINFKRLLWIRGLSLFIVEQRMRFICELAKYVHVFLEVRHLKLLSRPADDCGLSWVENIRLFLDFVLDSLAHITYKLGLNYSVHDSSNKNQAHYTAFVMFSSTYTSLKRGIYFHKKRWRIQGVITQPTNILCAFTYRFPSSFINF